MNGCGLGRCLLHYRLLYYRLRLRHSLLICCGLNWWYNLLRLRYNLFLHDRLLLGHNLLLHNRLCLRYDLLLYCGSCLWGLRGLNSRSRRRNYLLRCCGLCCRRSSRHGFCLNRSRCCRLLCRFFSRPYGCGSKRHALRAWSFCGRCTVKVHTVEEAVDVVLIAVFHAFLLFVPNRQSLISKRISVTVQNLL